MTSSLRAEEQMFTGWLVKLIGAKSFRVSAIKVDDK